MGSPNVPPAQLAPSLRAAARPAPAFSYMGLLRLASTVAGTVTVALAPHFGATTWYPILVAVAAGLGIHTVHTAGSSAGQAGGSNG